MGKEWPDGPTPRRYGRGELGPVMAIIRLPLADAIVSLHKRYPWVQTGLSAFIKIGRAHV